MPHNFQPSGRVKAVKLTQILLCIGQRHIVDDHFKIGVHQPCDQNMLQPRVDLRSGRTQLFQHKIIPVGGINLQLSWSCNEYPPNKEEADETLPYG